MTLRSRFLLGLGMTTALIASTVALTLAASPARSSFIDDDDEKAEARQVAEQAFRENCLMCHGADMTSRQRLTPKQWTVEVEKMIGWGTPLPPERKDGLIAYLSETYPTTLAPAPVERITPDAARHRSPGRSRSGSLAQRGRPRARGEPVHPALRRLPRPRGPRR